MIIIVDTETTGYAARNGGRVIEIGAVALDDGLVVAEFDSLIDTGAQISYGAFRVHGISEESLIGQPEPAAVWRRFREFIGNAPLVAHNAPFDSAFIRHELALLGHSLPNSWHCTVRLARKQLPHLPNHKLDTVYHHLFGPPPHTTRRHRALDDARMTARIWQVLTIKS